MLKRHTYLNLQLKAAKRCFILFLIIMHLYIFKISDLLIALYSIEKSYTFYLKDTSLDSIAPNLSDTLPK